MPAGMAYLDFASVLGLMGMPTMLHFLPTSASFYINLLQDRWQINTYVKNVSQETDHGISLYTKNIV